MLKISKHELKQEAKKHGYRSEMLEKVYFLLDLLEAIMQVPFLSERLALKGGTAINLFCSNNFPRLSVDLDFNYIGAPDKETMQKEKPELGKILIDICQRKQYQFQRNLTSYAGGKSVLTYKSLTGSNGKLEIDLNYLYRAPLWEPQWQTSPNLLAY